ncbi:MAG: acylphosphatase [Nanoarchaeota archaeon]
MKRVRILISGEVQGVSFRNFLKRNSVLLSLKGFCRNLQDGRVECVFEGENENIEKIIILCNLGPEKAKVNDINVKEEEFSAEFKDFSVL